MKKLSWQAQLSILLSLSFLLLFALHYLIFHDFYNLSYYTLLDVAFIPLQVLLVTVFLNNLLNIREKQAMLKKMNMAIGVFFSEIGTDFLRFIARTDVDTEKIKAHLLPSPQWREQEYRLAAETIQHYDFISEINPLQMVQLQHFMAEKRDFMLRLLENPNLLEHDSFTNMMWSIFHLSEELSHRGDEFVPGKDYQHLVGDIQRAYRAVTLEWLQYMMHLGDQYPYLFSFALRDNPFLPEPQVEIQ